MSNLEIAKLFNEIADVMELTDKASYWEIVAHRKAARVLENLSEDVADIYEDKGLKGLIKIEGIGKKLAHKIEEYVKSGKIKDHDNWMKKVPKKMLQLLDVPGMGPKKIKKLYHEKGIKSLNELKQAAKKHKIKGMKNFGEKTEQNILEGIKLVKSSKKRIPISFADPIAQELIEWIKNNSPVDKIDIMGSLRRMKETVKDIDILASSKKPSKVMETFVNYAGIKKIIAKGESKSSVVLKEGINVDLRIIDSKNYGAAMQYFTGSKDHNINLRKIAIEKNYKLNEYGIFLRNSEKFVAGKTEKSIYSKLGLQYIPPEMRENLGEIELAKKKKIPKLVELSDLKGDLHMHTKYSDGINSISEMIHAAKKFGLKYIAITDHSKSEKIANGLSDTELLAYIKDIKNQAKKIKGIKVLVGAEVDILKEGSLDYDDKLLKKLDIVIGAIHSGFKMNENEMTKRIITAMENKHFNILAHPTGKMIGKRESINANWKKIFDFAKENKIIFEINSQPSRLDFNGIFVKKVIDSGAKITVNSDSHNTKGFYYLKYGIGMARRGWCEKKHVINTYNFDKIKKIFVR